MERNDRLLSKLVNAAVIAEGLPGVPVMELAEDRRVLIENHRGITAYADEEICVKMKYGKLCIHGRMLKLAIISVHQLVICGCIDSIHIQREVT